MPATDGSIGGKIRTHPPALETEPPNNSNVRLSRFTCSIKACSKHNLMHEVRGAISAPTHLAALWKLSVQLIQIIATVTHNCSTCTVHCHIHSTCGALTLSCRCCRQPGRTRNTSGCPQHPTPTHCCRALHAKEYGLVQCVDQICKFLAVWRFTGRLDFQFWHLHTHRASG